jgi:hypothetical protein
MWITTWYRGLKIEQRNDRFYVEAFNTYYMSAKAATEAIDNWYKENSATLVPTERILR